MRSLLRARARRAVSAITAFTLLASTVLSSVPVAYAAGTVSSPPAVSAAESVVGAATPVLKAPPVRVREVPGVGTETARHFEMSDGTKQAEFYAERLGTYGLTVTIERAND